MAGKPRGKPFKPGEGGRPVGALNKATRDIKEASRRLLEDPEYQKSLAIRLKRGDAPHMETLLHHYGYGKPKDTLSVETPMRPLVIDSITEADVERRRDD